MLGIDFSGKRVPLFFGLCALCAFTFGYCVAQWNFARVISSVASSGDLCGIVFITFVVIVDCVITFFGLSSSDSKAVGMAIGSNFQVGFVLLSASVTLTGANDSNVKAIMAFGYMLWIVMWALAALFFFWHGELVDGSSSSSSGKGGYSNQAGNRSSVAEPGASASPYTAFPASNPSAPGNTSPYASPYASVAPGGGAPVPSKESA